MEEQKTLEEWLKSNPPQYTDGFKLLAHFDNEMNGEKISFKEGSTKWKIFLTDQWMESFSTAIAESIKDGSLSLAEAQKRVMLLISIHKEILSDPTHKEKKQTKYRIRKLKTLLVMLEGIKEPEKIKPTQYTEKARAVFLNLAFLNKKLENCHLDCSNHTKEFIKDFGTKNEILLNNKILNKAFNNRNTNIKVDIETFDQAVELYKTIFKEPPKKTNY
jgi:hypothetical protein